MTIKSFCDYDSMSADAASMVIEEVRKKPNLLLCTATGSSPSGLYHHLVAHHMQEELFRKLKIIKLDEWLGLEDNAEGSCEHFLQTRLIQPLEISNERYLSFAANAADPEQECLRIEKLIKHHPIDLCILGLGKNGHLGFNEPGLYVQAQCHVAKLTPESQEHAMITNSKSEPIAGMTLGMSGILNSKRILLLISGTGKEEARKQLMSGKITARCPASFLWLHQRVDCLVVE